MASRQLRCWSPNEIAWAEPVRNPPTFFKRRRRTAAQRRGISYEGQVHGELTRRCHAPLAYFPSPWFVYRIHGDSHFYFCQPDGVAFDFRRGIVYVFEVKYSHTNDAWRQLKHLYSPVLRSCFPPRLWEFRLVEVCRLFDCEIQCDATLDLVRDFRDPSVAELQVMIWKPK